MNTQQYYEKDGRKIYYLEMPSEQVESWVKEITDTVDKLHDMQKQGLLPTQPTELKLVGVQHKGSIATIEWEYAPCDLINCVRPTTHEELAQAWAK